MRVFARTQYKQGGQSHGTQLVISHFYDGFLNFKVSQAFFRGFLDRFQKKHYVQSIPGFQRTILLFTIFS